MCRNWNFYASATLLYVFFTSAFAFAFASASAYITWLAFNTFQLSGRGEKGKGRVHATRFLATANTKAAAGSRLNWKGCGKEYETRRRRRSRGQVTKWGAGEEIRGCKWKRNRCVCANQWFIYPANVKGIRSSSSAAAYLLSAVALRGISKYGTPSPFGHISPLVFLIFFFLLYVTAVKLKHLHIGNCICA